MPLSSSFNYPIRFKLKHGESCYSMVLINYPMSCANYWIGYVCIDVLHFARMFSKVWRQFYIFSSVLFFLYLSLAYI